MINLIDLIAGSIVVMAGIVTMFGMANFGVVLAGIGLLIEGIKIMLKMGL